MAVMVTATSARAEMAAKLWLERYDAAGDGKPVYEIQIRSIENGISWVQASLKTEKTICPPGNLVLQDKQIVSILREASRRNPDIADAPLGAALFYSLRGVFPCDKR
ncbi:hypothetical protein [Bosea sp. BK604]|uniref:hypothetical protein n=1 Tax=Bosea sp. BK604 TaxID=2512180 RepID=UPI00104DD5C4|nr:hypothetical protein [Bosea sp. BK604]